MSTYEKSVKDKVFDLKKKKLSIDKISEKLKIPKSTIQSWVSPKKKAKTIKKVEFPTTANASNVKYRTDGKIHRYDPAYIEKVLEPVLANKSTIKEAAVAHNLEYHTVFTWHAKAVKKKSIKKEIMPKINASLHKECESKIIQILKAQNDYLKRVIKAYNIDTSL